MSLPGATVPAHAGGQAPVYGFPEEAARALAHAARHHAWLTRTAGRVPELPDVRRDEAAGLLATALADGPQPRWLTRDEVARLFDCYGLPLASGHAARALGGVAELAVGVIHDASFGSVVACSVGGPTAELLRDVAVRITPLTDADAAEMVRSLAAFRCWTATAGSRRRTPPPWRICCFACPRWWTPTRRWQSWTAIRWSSGRPARA
jgi:acyl-CoA synthetase (NDP forming)